MRGAGDPPAAVRAPGVQHLYVHLPFCAHRCGYCDFVTVTGRPQEHGPYVDAVLAELAVERELLAERLETIFLGGGTPSFTAPDALARLLTALPGAREVTAEANPETVTPELAALLREGGVNRVSLGAQSFEAPLLSTLERRAGPDDVRRAFGVLREAGFDNLSLDLIYGIPGQTPAALDRDLDAALQLAPEHLSCYELEAKPGTRFTHAHGRELALQEEAMETYFERVVTRLTDAGYRWYETANFCLPGARDLRAAHNLAYWLGRDYLGIGLGAVSTVQGTRWQNTSRLQAYSGSLSQGKRPPRELERLDDEVRRRELLMLGLRLDEPLSLAEVEGVVDPPALRRLERAGFVQRRPGGGEDGSPAITLTRRGRFLGGGVTAELLR